MIKARRICTTGLSSALLLVLFGCQTDLSDTAGKGVLRLDMSVDAGIKAGSITKGIETQIDVPSVGEFTVLVLRDGAEILRFDRFSEYSGEVELPKGSYSLSAYYGDKEREGFDLPYFEGTKEFTITTGESTRVDLECMLANSIITLEYSDTFKEYFSKYNTTVKTASGNSFLIASDEERYAYVKPGKISATMDLTRQGGETGSESLKLQVVNNESVEAKKHYNFKFDVNAGGEMLEISFDDNVALQPIDINTINAPAPKFVLSGFESGKVYELAESSEKDMSLLVSANSGIANLKLTVNSAFLQSLGWEKGEIELTDISNKDVVARIKQLGIKIRGLENLDKMVELDFSDLVPKLQVLNNESLHDFKISVTDKFGKTCDDVEFSVNSLHYPLSMMPNDAPIYIGSERFNLYADTEGDISKVKFFIEERGEWKPVNAVNITPLSEGYNVTFDYQTGVNDFKVKGELGSSSPMLDMSVVIPQYSLSLISELNVWAKRANISIQMEDESLFENVMKYLSLSVNGVNKEFSVDGNTILITGLEPDETNIITANCKSDIEDARVVIKTEAALQVPNADMEDWYYTRPSSSVKYWEVWYSNKEGEASAWGTLNQRTTSEGGSNTSMFSNRNGCRYCANSGTIKTTDAKSGDAAALIRAVGWGSGNSAVGSANAKYGDCGYLYLGYYDTATKTPVYDGIGFTSRPEAMSFYYKYAPGNGGDNYLAEIVLQHRMDTGEVIEVGRGTKRDG